VAALLAANDAALGERQSAHSHQYRRIKREDQARAVYTKSTKLMGLGNHKSSGHAGTAENTQDAILGYFCL
jgi:hypothetical protein